MARKAVFYTSRFNNRDIEATSFNLQSEKITPVNKVLLEGQIQAPITIVDELVHLANDTYLKEKCIQFPVCVYRISRDRLSGQPVLKYKDPDIIPVRIKLTSLIANHFSTPDLSELEGAFIRVNEGTYRSDYVNDVMGHHVAFLVEATDFEFIDSEECKFTNRIFLRGFICNPNFEVRKTGAGPIIDLKLAVNRVEYSLGDLLERKKIPTDYIQCITWNDVTEYLLKNLSTGDLVDIEGRFQSRSFPSNAYRKVVHEVSVVDLT